VPSGHTFTIDGRDLTLTNLDKILYPATGTTKGEVIEYYARIAPVMLPHLAGRGVTFNRFPNGVERPGFFEKRCNKHRPTWVPTAAGPGDHNGTIRYCVIDGPAALVWAANLAALEIHAPMALAEDLGSPQMIVFDFDPGAPAGMPECARTALAVQEVLGAVGLQGWPKTSGSKGLQLYVPLNTPCTHEHAASFALAVGQLLERQHPTQVLTSMTKASRKGKVFIDWSQNARHKTTIAVYSLRARSHPTVSTPVTWEEIEQTADEHLELRFEWRDVLARVDDQGDLFAPVLEEEQELPAGVA
jgi:bifunctional non-homologous end joining protein LigD